MKNKLPYYVLFLIIFMAYITGNETYAQDYTNLIRTHLASEQKNSNWKSGDISEWAITDQFTDETTNRYVWSPGDTIQSISVNNAGTYTVTVTDGNGCGVTQKNNGSASNAFTNIFDGTNAIVADNTLNTIVFIHRNDSMVFGGNSGHLRYDLSTDGGNSWTNDLGVLNPVETYQARYPQVAIFNPEGNAIPANSYLAYLAPTTGTTWNGLVSGVRKLDGTGNTEHYNQPASSQTYIPTSMVKGAPGVFWTIDALYTGTSFAGFRVYKGVWNGSSDVVWSTNETIVPPFNTSYSGLPQVADYQIAFDPSGQFGWVSILTHLTGESVPFAFYPVFYKTVDGGETWTGPTQVKLSDFNCIRNNITPGNFPSTAFDADLTVDANGEPHLLVPICNGNNAYAIYYSLWHHMYDITNHGGVWNALDISNVKGGRGTYGTSPNTATMDQIPMISRSPDGTKVFFAWTDNNNYSTGSANNSPNIFSRGYDVSIGKWTAVKDFSVCNPTTDGKIFFPKMAAEALEPVSGSYKLAAIRTEMTSNDPFLTANFHYLDGLSWNEAEFTEIQPVTTVSINQGSNVSFCPGETFGLSISGTYDKIYWSTGSTGLTTTIDTAGIFTVAVRNGCTTAIDTITAVLYPVTTPVISGTTEICYNDSTTLDAGVFESYVWSNGKTTRTISVLSAGTYTVTVTNTNGCKGSDAVTITVYPNFVRGSISSNQSICYNLEPSTLNGTAPTGGNTPYAYQWQKSTDNINFIDISSATATNYSPGSLTQTTNYRLKQSSASGCGNAITDTVTITIEPIPVNGVLTKIPDVPSVCFGADLSATFTSGSGGNGTDVVQYRTKDDGTWSGWLPYDQNHSIITNTIDSAQIMIYRDADYCNPAIPDTISWQITSPSIGGAVTGGTQVCYGVNSTVLSLTGQNGAVQRWELSTDNEHWTNIDDSTRTTFTAVNLTQDTWYRALIQSGTCEDVHSVETQITVLANLQISGYAQYENNPHTPLNGLKVILNKLESNTFVKVDSVETNALGFYEFEGLANATYGLTVKSAHPSGAWQTWSGVNNTDYLLVARHVAGTTLLPVNPPVVMVSASVKVPHPLINSVDANAIRQAAKYPVTGWSYFDIPKWVFSGLNQSARIDTMQLSCASITRDIRGLCAGDVNGTYMPAGGYKIATPNLQLVNRGTLPINREITFPVRAEQDMELGAITLMLDYDPSLIEITGVTMPENSGAEPWFEVQSSKFKVAGTLNLEPETLNMLNIGWMSLDPVNVSAGQTVLMIHARVNNVVVETGFKPVFTGVSTIRFTLNENPLSELADGEGNVLNDARLSVPNAGFKVQGSMFNEGTSVVVYPNPVKDVLNVEIVIDNINMEVNHTMALELVTMHGVVVAKQNIADIKTGMNRTTMDLRDLPNGAYLLKVDGGEIHRVIKVVINR